RSWKPSAETTNVTDSGPPLIEKRPSPWTIIARNAPFAILRTRARASAFPDASTTRPVIVLGCVSASVTVTGPPVVAIVTGPVAASGKMSGWLTTRYVPGASRPNVTTAPWTLRSQGNTRQPPSFLSSMTPGQPLRRGSVDGGSMLIVATTEP